MTINDTLVGFSLGQRSDECLARVTYARKEVTAKQLMFTERLAKSLLLRSKKDN